MGTINDRISQCVKDSGLTKTEFAKRINVTQQYVSSLCNGKKKPSDRTIADICREFNIRESWLRDAEGEMYSKTPDTIMERLTQELKADKFLQNAIYEYLNLPEAERTFVRNFIFRIASKDSEFSSMETGAAVQSFAHMNEDREITDEDAAAMAAGEIEAFRQQKIAEIKGKARSLESCATNSEPTGKTSPIPEPSMNSSTQNGYSARINGKEVAG